MDGYTLAARAREVCDDPEVRRALAERDITTVYRRLVAAGLNQRQIADLTGQRPSEISEIVNGRAVQSIVVLERIADGLGVPRGWMGLAFAGGRSRSEVYAELELAPDAQEVDEDVKRRSFLAVAGTELFGQPLFGTPSAGALTIRDVHHEPPSRVGMADVESFTAVTARLGVLDRTAGGVAARETLAAVAAGGDQLLTAEATDQVRHLLRGAVSEAHRLAGWASGDVGMVDHCRWHMRRAMDLAQGDAERLAGVLAAAGDMEKHYRAPGDALKLFQLGTIGLPVNGDPQARAVLHGLAAGAYLTLGHPDQARAELRTARSLFSDAPDAAASLPFFAFYGPGHGLLAATGSKLADYDSARTDVQQALDTRPDYDVRCRALDTIVLATILINAGELRDGIMETRRALALVQEVGSQRVRDRLAPLGDALTGRNDSTCRDLARQVRAATAESPQP